MNSIEPEKVTGELVEFLKTSFQKAGFTKTVLALSGGVDSAVSCALVARALGVDSVYPVLLPYGALSTQGTLDAMSVIESLKIPPSHVTRFDIKPIVDQLISKDPGMDNVRKGNAMARARMLVLFDQAKKRQAIVTGTENKTEHILGYYTRFGDEASDIEPLRNLYKTQIYKLAKHLELPDVVRSRAPTAGLWEGQTDEGEFGFSYEDADGILALHFDENKSEKEIVATGFAREIVSRVLARASANDFKHHLPIIP